VWSIQHSAEIDAEGPSRPLAVPARLRVRPCHARLAGGTSSRWSGAPPCSPLARSSCSTAATSTS